MADVTANPAGHEAHELPLVDRLIDGEITGWLDRKLALAAAANDRTGERRFGYDEAIEAVRYLHLAGAYYELTPMIVKVLRRAGLIVERER